MHAASDTAVLAAMGHALPSPLIDTAGAAAFLQMSESWLEHDRTSDKPEIPFVRMGRRTVRYRIGDLIAYAAKQLRGTKAAA